MKTLTLGVLVCDSVRPELLPIAGDYPEMFECLFREPSPDGPSPDEPGLQLRFYDVTRGHYPGRLDECAGYLTSGSAASVNDEEPWIAVFARFIRRLHRERAKLFAICFGHQMIARALAGRVASSPRGWGVGVHVATVTHPQPWMIPAASSFRLIGSHQEQIVELPPGAVVLASSPHCPLSMVRCGSLVGIQGHPEFRAPYAKALMNARAAIIPAPIRTAASASFDTDPDHALLASWIRHFLQAP